MDWTVAIAAASALAGVWLGNFLKRRSEGRGSSRNYRREYTLIYMLGLSRFRHT
jgi:hypothetical protein